MSEQSYVKLLVAIVENGAPCPPQKIGSKGVNVCMQMRWVRSDEEGNLVPTGKGLSVYTKYIMLRAAKEQALRERAACQCGKEGGCCGAHRTTD